jgi:hypothetical protein
MTPQRYLVALDGLNLDLGGFSCPDLDRALLALIRIRLRWPRAELLVIPAQQGGGMIRKK